MPHLPDAPEASAEAATSDVLMDEPLDAPAAPVAASAEEHPNAEQTRLEILEALQRGEITTREALLLLRQLDE
jgi:hypothetical protein